MPKNYAILWAISPPDAIVMPIDMSGDLSWFPLDEESTYIIVAFFCYRFHTAIRSAWISRPCAAQADRNIRRYQCEITVYKFNMNYYAWLVIAGLLNAPRK